VAIERGDWRPTDLELVEKARQGDSAAFHELVDRHARPLFALAFSLSGNAADAEDALQEMFTGAFRGLRGFEGRSSVKTWLVRILVRQVAGRRRKAGRQPTQPLDAAAEATAAVLAPFGSTEARIDVMAAIRTLNPEHRDVVLLREIQGLSYDEIAGVLDVPLGTVESRLFRARQALRERLKEYLG
jgi:RNA polymerase sigma-70 factor, ECF subfamily